MSIRSTNRRTTTSRLAGRWNRLATSAVVLAAVSITLLSCERRGIGELDAAEIRENFPEVAARELVFAAATGDEKEIRKIVGDGVEVDSLGRDGQTPLVIAVKFNQHDSVRALLDLGANPDHRIGSTRDSPVQLVK